MSFGKQEEISAKFKYKTFSDSTILMNFEFVDIVQKILLVVSESNRLGKRSNKVSSSRGFGSTTDDAWTVCDLST